jgi:hypothetical protein
MEKVDSHFPDHESYKHPSFGLLSFCRTNGNSKFFGSDATHDSYITLTLKKAKLDRSLSKDWMFEDGDLVNVRLTEMQFASLITSLNVGSGVPVTIEYLQGKVEKLPEVENRKDFVLRRVRDEVDKIQNQILPNQEKLKAILEKKSFNKEDKSAIHDLVYQSQRVISDSLPFYLKCFEEALGEMVTEAEIEAEAKIVNKINHLGKEVLKTQLENKKDLDLLNEG